MDAEKTKQIIEQQLDQIEDMVRNTITELRALVAVANDEQLMEVYATIIPIVAILRTGIGGK